MARRNESNAEALVAVAAIADRVGWPIELVLKRVGHVVADWDGTPCVAWSEARQLYETLSAEKAESDRERSAAMDAQLDAEQHARMWPVRAYEAAVAARSDTPGVVSFGPDDGEPAPAWVEAPSRADQ